MTNMRLLRSGLLALVLGAPLSAAAQAPTVEYYHVDALGSVRAVTNASGGVVRRHDYAPFGEELATALGADQMRFAGKERDVETAFDYLGARHLRPSWGRFATIDPVMRSMDALLLPQQWNRYAYVSNNPLRKLDPTGGYEIDVHYHLTRALSRAVGLSPAIAEAIARADQGVDDTPGTGPFSGVEARRNFHFTTNERREQLWSDFERSGRPADLGTYFHAQQDSFSHEGYGPRIGHLLAGHSPDRTFNDPGRADRMARDTYDRLRTAAARLEGTRRSVVPWETLRTYVERFNRARTLADKIGILEELTRLIESRAQ